MAEFVTKKENGRRLAIIILCAIAMAVSIAVGIYALKEANFYAENQENPYNIKAQAQKVAERRAAVEELKQNYLSYAKNFGWYDEAHTSVDRFGRGPLNPRAMKDFLSDVVSLREEDASKGRKSLFETLDIQAYSRWPESGKAESNLTIVAYFDELLKKENEYRAAIEDLKKKIQEQKQQWQQDREGIESSNKAAYEALVGSVATNQPAQGRIGDLISLYKQYNDQLAQHTQELADLELDTVAKQNEATALKNENLRKRAAGASVKEDLQRRIFAIQHHRLEERERREPDGVILGIDEALQIAYIDLLRKDRLFLGTRFYVYSTEKGGQKLDKGEIEVRQIREENSSICAIVRVYDEEWPLKVGDRIYNELFEGSRPRHIAFAGTFTGRLSNHEAASLVRSFGDIYQPQVTENTNYVVVAKGYEKHPNYLAAVEYGIKILREPILYDYLGVPRE